MQTKKGNYLARLASWYKVTVEFSVCFSANVWEMTQLKNTLGLGAPVEVFHGAHIPASHNLTLCARMELLSGSTTLEDTWMLSALTASAPMVLHHDAGRMEGSKRAQMGVTLIPPLNLGKGMLIDVTHPPYLPRKLRRSKNAELDRSLCLSRCHWNTFFLASKRNFQNFTLGWLQTWKRTRAREAKGLKLNQFNLAFCLHFPADAF